MIRLSAMVRRAVLSCGLMLHKKSHPFSRYFNLPPDSGLKYALHRAFRDLRGLRFLQIGANDGSRTDPLVSLIHSYDWSGTLVEPRDVFIRALKVKYSGNPRIQLLRAAIAPTSVDRTLYFIQPHTVGLPDWAHGLATLDLTRIETARQELGLPADAVGQETVRCLTWNDLHTQHSLDSLDLLVMDTEGYDIPLLDLWNWEKHLPRIIQFENGCAPAEQHFSIIQKARMYGYECVTEGPDTTLYLPT